MAITLNTLAYEQDTFESANRVKYVGPANSFTIKDTLTLGRTLPKATATFSGVARSNAKRVKTLTLPDGSKHDAIISVDVSLPVGAVDADVDALRDDVGDFLISATAGLLIKKHDLTF